MHARCQLVVAACSASVTELWLPERVHCHARRQLRHGAAQLQAAHMYDETMVRACVTYVRAREARPPRLPTVRHTQLAPSLTLGCVAAACVY